MAFDDTSWTALAAAMIASRPSLSLLAGQQTDNEDLLAAARRLIDAEERLIKAITTRIDDARRAEAIQQESITQLEQYVASLSADLALALAQASDAESKLKRELMKPSSRSALERVLMTALAKAYGIGIDEDASVRPIASQLSTDALTKFGWNLDEKTIRKYVTGAIDQYLASSGS